VQLYSYFKPVFERKMRSALSFLLLETDGERRL